MTICATPAAHYATSRRASDQTALLPGRLFPAGRACESLCHGPHGQRLERTKVPFAPQKRQPVSQSFSQETNILYDNRTYSQHKEPFFLSFFNFALDALKVVFASCPSFSKVLPEYLVPFLYL